MARNHQHVEAAPSSRLTGAFLQKESYIADAFGIHPHAGRHHQRIERFRALTYTVST